MIMSRRSVHLTTLFNWASLTKQLTSFFHDQSQSPRKYRTRQGLIPQPLDLLSDLLPTALWGLVQIGLKSASSCYSALEVIAICCVRLSPMGSGADRSEKCFIML